MTSLHNDNQHNFVNFIRQNQPIPPQACPDLEQRIIDSLEPQTTKEPKRSLKSIWTIPNAIATGFLLTSVSFGVRTPRIAIEPKDLENFLVSSWQDTFNAYESDYTAVEENQAYWLLPTISETSPTLSVSAQ